MKKLSYCGLLLMAALGCGPSNKESVATGQPEQSPPMQNNVAQANAATQPVVTNGAGTEPGEIVALFLDSLRRGDENAANGVLTAQAQAELAKTDYVIQPLGTPEGKYTIGRVGFVDGDTTIGLVECLWTEPNPELGKPPIELDIVCEVRKEAQGWRISGLAVKMTGTEETLVLDFEDAASLQQALEQAGGQPPAEPAAATTAVVAQDPSQPQGDALQPTTQSAPLAFPTQPQFDSQPSTQIALPPSGGAINR